MRPRYTLEPLSPDQLQHWDDLIAPYASRQLFHRRAWLDYLAGSRALEIRQWAIRERDHLVGYFCGGIVRKGPFRILGSPLKGWGTNYMGPIVDSDFDQRSFLNALDELARREQISMVEIESPVLGDDVMKESAYEAVDQQTYIIPINPSDPEQTWKAIDIKSRQKVRKARRMGVTVEEATDPTMTVEFYDQFVEVLARKNLFPPYDQSCPRQLWEHLHPKGLLLALVVRSPEGVPIATGLFPHDDRTIYFWGGASRIAAWNFSANDLLQWTVMEKAAALGLQVYNMCGYGPFKSKFGGDLQHPRRWHKFYSRAARWARRSYEMYFNRRIRVRGWYERVLGGRGADTN